MIRKAEYTMRLDIGVRKVANMTDKEKFWDKQAAGYARRAVKDEASYQNLGKLKWLNLTLLLKYPRIKFKLQFLRLCQYFV